MTLKFSLNKMKNPDYIPRLNRIKIDYVIVI